LPEAESSEVSDTYQNSDLTLRCPGSSIDTSEDIEMKTILVLFAHPALQISRVNKAMLGDMLQISGVKVHDLYERYPDFDIDVQQEQKLMTEHDVIVFHHPFFWYSTPAILKEWQDLVLEHNWAYGSKGTALHGKYFLNIVTTGGRETAYEKNGHNRYTMRELLAPIEQTARLCGMIYLPPFVVHGTHGLSTQDINSHTQDCRRFLEAMRDDRIDLEAAGTLSRINTDLDTIILK
jgi:glutathione-regulated potassium-efflux system ancillary protein KefG